jgi:hypothetical protein
MVFQIEEFLMRILEEWGSNDMLFQKYGAPSHFHKKVTHFLNRKFTEKWTGRGGPNTWPPRSPDLTPFGFRGGGLYQGCCVRATIGY